MQNASILEIISIFGIVMIAEIIGWPRLGMSVKSAQQMRSPNNRLRRTFYQRGRFGQTTHLARVKICHLDKRSEVMMKICENCTFWIRYADRSWGVCHRYPEFVEQNEEEWCGEYVARQPGPTETASFVADVKHTTLYAR